MKIGINVTNREEVFYDKTTDCILLTVLDTVIPIGRNRFSKITNDYMRGYNDNKTLEIVVPVSVWKQLGIKNES